MDLEFQSQEVQNQLLVEKILKKLVQGIIIHLIKDRHKLKLNTLSYKKTK